LERLGSFEILGAVGVVSGNFATFLFGEGLSDLGGVLVFGDVLLGEVTSKFDRVETGDLSPSCVDLLEGDWFCNCFGEREIYTVENSQSTGLFFLSFGKCCSTILLCI